MPIHRGKDSIGSFYQWGYQKKYYYTSGNKKSRETAKLKAREQEKAIYAQRYKSKSR